MALGVIVALVLLLAAATLLAVWTARSLRVARQWNARLAGLIEAVPDQGLLLLDPAGYVRHCNGAARQLHGYGEREIAGQHYELLFTPEDRSARVAENELEAAARDGPRVARGRRMHRDGQRLMVETRLTALREASGRLRGFSVVERDISERLEQEHALAEARATFSSVQKLAALGRLSEGIAHEFNNVVHVIKTSVALLQRRCAADEQSAGLLHMIERNADGAAGLSQHLLAPTRREPSHPVATDVNEVVSTMVALLRQTLNENIVVEQQLDESLSWVSVERSELEAALLHVAANARDAMPAGGRLTFRTAELLQPAALDNGHSRPARHSVLVSICDTTNAATSPPAQEPALASAVAAQDAAEKSVARVRSEVRGVAAVHATRDEPNLQLLRGLLEHSHGQLQIERGDEGAIVNLYLPARTG
jgi:PAS domain S-box-containing protein